MRRPPLITALLSPGAYPERPPDVTLVQTHISYVFILPEVVYKIKKPVDFGFLDFSTLDKRRHYCEEEVRLNRRLAPDVYLGVVPITFNKGQAGVNGAGEPVEYAVKMRRVPDNALLYHAIKDGRAGPETMGKIARTIAAFHKTAETSERVAAFGQALMIGYNVEENFEQTARFAGSIIGQGRYERIKAYTRGFMIAEAGLFARRIDNGFIKDCHGDMHSEHVVVSDGIEIMDCIEFNERFRFSDTAADAAFLSMDLDFLGRHDLASVFDRAYCEASGDNEGCGSLMEFYRCYRAYVRGKVAAFKSIEQEVGEDEALEAYMDALRHFHLAGLYADGGYRPMLVVVRGLSGTGKTTLAQAISQAADMPVVSSDIVRKRLAGMRTDEHASNAYNEGIYSPEFTDKTYNALIDEAGRMLASGRPVIVEATFASAGRLDAAIEAAIGAGARVRIIECRADDEIVKRNMAARAAIGTVSDADFAIYKRQKEGFEATQAQYLIVNAATTFKRNLRLSLEYIFN
ncbi:MAG: AAA family ATPase [Deltaproteobacteria bacterium]|nr:AAA family ATPase [Deltaproteobacteria bacterium]